MSTQPLPAPPRRVRGKLGCGVWFVRLFTLPHVLAGVGVTGYFLLVVLWQLFGTNVPGTVTDTEVYHSSKSGDSYTLKYSFQIDGQMKSESDGVSYNLYLPYKTRSSTNPPVTVRYFSILGFEHAALYTDRTFWKQYGGLVFWVTCWDVAMGFVVYMLWIKPLSMRWLYKYGEATTGTLVRKRVQTGKSSTYYITYSFRHPYSGEVQEAEIVVWNEPLWAYAIEGQPVTVLFSPNNPKRSTVYEFGGYQVLAE
jgi:hypothetical protein